MIDDGANRAEVNAGRAVAWGWLAVTLGILFYAFFNAGGRFYFSVSGEELARFGTFFGGFVGPLLSFITLVLIATTVRLQIKAMNALNADSQQQARAMSDKLELTRAQTVSLAEQLEILKNEHRIARLENMAATAKATFERYLSSNILGFSHPNLESLVEAAVLRAGMRKLMGRPLSLVEILEAERQGVDAITDPATPTKMQVLASRVAAVDVFPRLSWALDEYRVYLEKIAIIDTLNEKTDKQNYIYSRLEPYTGLVQKLYLLGLLQEKTPSDWVFSGSSLIRNGRYVTDDEQWNLPDEAKFGTDHP